LEKLKNQPKDIFMLLDSVPLRFGSIDLLGFLRNVHGWRRYFLFCVVACSVCWLVFGFDSTWSQLLPFVDNLPLLLTGKVSLEQVWKESQKYYGTGNHFSAPVIYGSAWILLSIYLEKIGIRKSKNFILTSALSLANIGVFEWIYNLLYANLQHQPWTITFAWKQVTNLTSFTLYTFVGSLALLYLYTEGYKPNTNRTTKILFTSALFFILLWVFFPFPTETLTVETTVGTWTSSNLFPQTMYAVDLDPTDGLAVGKPFHVNNDLLHFVNLMAKICFTAFFLSLCMVKKNA